ncbi:MAG TPA: transcription termination/antitermination protein NusA [Flavobacteriales bacterium]|jgi:N utilization substance protein A|nr:transcription termination/antitermination protein NusA [Flavobacteriales bacterium]HHZ97656.1 transcription termination/antitermination protein NusA [Flavobacteriales bacterium]HIB76016.1 transcription termination/antitermination protein NusA [Flavobacteriales bacterium]HIN41698.1 transcription termination/antitermination protein NusA [Flavobacteriales bacterium]HIO16420.1 transcription termination/antitermination protein NusA [Flavobacteriales bacterium]
MQLNLIDSFREFKEFKNFDKETMMAILEDVFRNMIIKKFGTDENFDLIINPEKGDLEIWRNREIVANDGVEDSNEQISLDDALKIENDFEVGEEVSEEIKLESFGRRAVLSLRQNLVGRIMEIEKDAIYQKYKERIGEVVTAEVYQIWKREILLVDDDDNEVVMPREHQIPGDFFKKGDSVRAVVAAVELRNNTPRIILSRTAPEFLERLFEMEVPEIFDGLITIKKIVRSPGERAKVAVESYDDRVDPVGACVGMKGSRIHSIVRELRNENIDVINWTENQELLMSRSLSPAKVSSITLKDDTGRAEVYLKPDQVSLAIGKGGNNIKLAGLLTGYEIDVFREEDDAEEDVELMEFSDEIDSWILEEFIKIGCDTARSVLDLDEEGLISRTDLEAETVKEVVRILKKELE